MPRVISRDLSARCSWRLFIALGLAGGPAAEARPGARRRPRCRGPVFAWILLDAETGQVLSEQNADVLTYPASLTKMMTLYLTFEALNQGRVRIDQLFTVSAEAASRSPSKLGLTPGETIPLRDLILGSVTRSANDAASVIAENLAGSEANFARYMTWKARQLGMQNSWYQNASGLPDPAQRTTARDIARLALALYHDFPREYRYFSTQEFSFRGEQIHTHNHLLEWYPGADGIKTGFVNASGFNIATSAVRNGRRLIGVIMGGRSAHSRDVQMASLLDQGFAALGNRQPAGRQRGRGGAHDLSKGLLLEFDRGIAAAGRGHGARRLRAGRRARAAPVRARPRQPPSRTTKTTNEAETEDPKTAALRRVTSAALRHLAPVSKAQAAPAVHVKAEADDGWSIQLGAFRDQSAARQALHRIAGVAVRQRKAAAGSGAAEIGSPRAVPGPAASFQREWRAGGLHRH